VNALATDGQTLAFRATSAGRDTIHKLTIKGGAETALVTEFHPATLSPPAISDGTIVYSIWGKFSTQIEAISPSGSTRIVRKDGPWKVVSNPSISGDSLAYVRSRYCDQTLMTGKLSGRTNGRGDRVKLRIRSTAARDPGYERHYTHHFNAASKCHRRKFAKYHGTLWTTGLTPSRAMVTLLGHNRARPHVVTINR
jgi:hypothetical protein